jgi:hypothetical protein
MVQLIVQLAKTGFSYFLMTILSGRFIGDVIIYILDKIAKKTDNTVDDDLVNMLKKAFNNEPYKEEGREYGTVSEGREPGPQD